MALILITDIGYDPDDLIALLYLMKRGTVPHLIVTSDEARGQRYRFAMQVLELTDSGPRVVRGIDHGHGKFLAGSLLKSSLPEGPEDYADAMAEAVLNHEARSTIISIGAFSEVAGFVRKYNNLARSSRCRFFQMGGALDYDRGLHWIEHNVKIDPASARYVLRSGIDLTLVGAQTTFDPRLLVDEQSSIYQRFAASKGDVGKLVVDHLNGFHAAKSFWSMMHDPLACSVALGEQFVEFEEVKIIADRAGRIDRYYGGTPVKISRPNCDAPGFMQHLEEVLFGK